MHIASIAMYTPSMHSLTVKGEDGAEDDDIIGEIFFWLRSACNNCENRKRGVLV